MTDLTRLNDNFQKKGICIMAAPLIEGADVDNGEIAAATANHLLANLPKDAYITGAFVFTETVSDAATSAVLTLGASSGATDIMTAGDLATAGKTGTVNSSFINTGTGLEVWANITITGAATAVGKYRVIVEYIEHTKDTGEYTVFN